MKEFTFVLTEAEVNDLMWLVGNSSYEDLATKLTIQIDNQ